jgi:hypothetical protein
MRKPLVADRRHPSRPVAATLRRPAVATFAFAWSATVAHSSRTTMRSPPDEGAPPSPKDTPSMLILGIILIIIGAVTNIPVLYSIGVVLAIIGLVLIVLGLLGREVGGRRHYW